MTDNPEWMNRAACRDKDPDLFFPTTDAERRAAIEICDDCPVREECGAYADRSRINGYPLSGIWGGRFRKIGYHPTRKKSGPDTENTH